MRLVLTHETIDTQFLFRKCARREAQPSPNNRRKPCEVFEAVGKLDWTIGTEDHASFAITDEKPIVASVCSQYRAATGKCLANDVG